MASGDNTQSLDTQILQKHSCIFPMHSPCTRPLEAGKMPMLAALRNEIPEMRFCVSSAAVHLHCSSCLPAPQPACLAVSLEKVPEPTDGAVP